MAATATAIIAGAPLVAYAAAVVASAAVTTTRPAQSTLIPSISVTPDQLTAANVAVSWVEAAGIAAAGLLAGVLISVAGIAAVFAVCAGLGVAATLLVAGLRVPPLASAPERAPAVLAGLGKSIRLTAGQPRLRLMMALLTAEAVVVGALDVASRTLLQRSVPAQLRGRVFGVLEGLTMAGLAVGALLVPALVYLGGSQLALLGVAAVLPLAAAVGGRALFGLDAGAPVPVVEIALLRSLPLFRRPARARTRGSGRRPHPGPRAGRHRADAPGWPGGRVLCDRRR